jgi:hypothetical protein
MITSILTESRSEQMSDTMALPVIEVNMPAPVLSKSDREYLAFQRLLPELLKTHRGKHVAIHDEQVVDSDVNDTALIKRVHAKVGYVPIHVGLVVDPQPVFRVGYYRELRRGGSDT